MDVSKNSGTPKSSILIGFSIIFTIHFGVPLFLETPISLSKKNHQKSSGRFEGWDKPWKSNYLLNGFEPKRPWNFTLPETNITRENRPSQKESSIPTIYFQGLC